MSVITKNSWFCKILLQKRMVESIENYSNPTYKRVLVRIYPQGIYAGVNIGISVYDFSIQCV